MASIASLVDIGARSANHIRQFAQDFRVIPEEILALSDEINDFATVLTEVERTSREIGANASHTGQLQITDALTRQINRAQIQLQAIETFISSIRQASSAVTSWLQLHPWLIKKKKIAGKLNRDLQNTKNNLQILLVANAA